MSTNTTIDLKSDPGQLVATARIDPRGWEALVARYGRMVTSIARSHGLSEADTADVSQTVWLRLVEQLDRLHDPERVGAWLATTARHESLRVSRLRARNTPVADLESFRLVDESSDRLARVEIEERDAMLHEAMATLPGHQRALLGMLMADPQPSYGEVSARLGIPVGSIGPTRQRGLRTLRARCVAAAV